MNFKFKMQNAKCKILAVVMLMVIAGCAHVAQQGNDVTAAKTLLAMKESIVAVAVTADQMCTQRLLTQKQCDRINEMYQRSQVTYDFAADALTMAISNNSSDAWSVYQTHHGAFLKLFGDITNIAIEYGLIPAIEGGAR